MESADYFIGGLLHDAGKMALLKAIPKIYRKIFNGSAKKEGPLKQREKKALGFDHNQIGAMLAAKWNLPINIGYCMSNYGGRVADEKTRQLLDCVQAAHIIASIMEYGYSGGDKVSRKLPPHLKKRFGKGAKKLIMSLGGISEDIAKARVLLQVKDNDKAA